MSMRLNICEGEGICEKGQKKKDIIRKFRESYKLPDASSSNEYVLYV